MQKLSGASRLKLTKHAVAGCSLTPLYLTCVWVFIGKYEPEIHDIHEKYFW